MSLDRAGGGELKDRGGLWEALAVLAVTAVIAVLMVLLWSMTI